MDAGNGIHYRRLINKSEPGYINSGSRTLFKEMKHKYTHLLWDFNGTIYADMNASRMATNCLLKARGLKEISTPEEMRQKFCFPVKDYYEYLGFDYSVEKYEDIAAEWINLYLAMSEQALLCEGVADAITKLHNDGYIQSIISACEHTMLQEKLQKLGISRFFCDISGTNDVSAHSKSQVALKWRENNPDATAIMIGDTPHDYEVASLIGVDCVLYSGGFVSESRLKNIGVPIVSKFDELFNYIY